MPSTPRSSPFASAFCTPPRRAISSSSAAAARYSRTELWAYGGIPPKPAGLTYQDWIMQILDRWPPEYRRKIKARVRQEIRAHFARTDLPILESTKSPITGVSWKWLVQLAWRGDFKARKVAMALDEDRIDPAVMAKYLEQVERERASA